MYYNRDLSWLDFNYRVLQEATKDHVPLYERIKFLSIFSANLDEFFSIRFPVVAAILNLKVKTQKKIEHDIPGGLLERIQAEIEQHIKIFDEVFEQQIIPRLRREGVTLYYKQQLLPEHAAEARDLFLSRILSFVQPVFLQGDVAARFAPEAGKPYMLVSLQKDTGEEMQHAVIRIPSDIPGRFLTLSEIDGQKYIAFVDDIIRENARFIFPGFTVSGLYSIKFNRNAELDLEGDYEGDILKKIERHLADRKRGAPSRFVFERGMPKNILLYLTSIFGVNEDSIFTDGRYQNLKDLAGLPVFDKKLTYDEWQPVAPIHLPDVSNMFRVIEERDILLHFPYHPYNPVLAFFNQAAIDPDVEEIYISLYRIATDSLIANALMSAARNGKKVTAFIELKARFDEANNIAWSKKMKQAGIGMIYSIPGIKVHSKIALVRQKSSHGINSYAIVSTGNFNELTANFYTDHTLFTADPTTNAELLQLFKFLEKQRPAPGNNFPYFKKLLVAQFNMVLRFEKLIRSEIKKSRAAGNGLIRVKVNNLEEPGIIDLLYKASKAGVKVRLIVRSICCLVPGVSNLSENIEVKRLVGRYLEHSRLFIFGEDESAEIIMGSSDWMTRNLYHRIEACTPVEDPACRQELLDYFELQWRESDGTDINPDGAEMNAQRSIYDHLKDKA